MNEPAEALAQLARLLGDESLRTAAPEAARSAAARAVPRLADGLTAEAAASDDVSDQESALSYIDQRLQALSVVIDASTRAQVRDAAREHIEKW